MNYIIIDGSYFIFYRYHAFNLWLRKSKQIDISNNEFFVKFETLFIKKLKEIENKLKLKNCNRFIAKDCKRYTIWRNNIYKNYKSTRHTKDDNISNIFKYVYDNKLFTKGKYNKILECDTLEADDCIAITTKYLLEKNKNCNIYIIANDMDYLQLISDNVNIYNLKYMNLKYSKNSFGDPNKDLFSKIVLGDKSDNIKGIFKKCNKKELEKYYNDKEYFYLQLNSNEELLNRYNLNCKIIDFNYIPIELQNKFISLSLSSLSLSSLSS